jgi:hypothetical protein
MRCATVARRIACSATTNTRSCEASDHRTSGIQPDPGVYAAWHLRFGGATVLQACGVESTDVEGLRYALRTHLDWMARLPWVMEGSEGRSHWVAVHAGLDESPLRPQLQQLHEGWVHDDGHPAALFDKARAFVVPADLPDEWCVISGHTPLTEVVVTPQRILCDTSGGMPRPSAERGGLA